MASLHLFSASLFLIRAPPLWIKKLQTKGSVQEKVAWEFIAMDDILFL